MILIVATLAPDVPSVKFVAVALAAALATVEQIDRNGHCAVISQAVKFEIEKRSVVADIRVQLDRFATIPVAPAKIRQ